MPPETFLAGKRQQGRIARQSGAVAWKAGGPYFELDNKPTDVQLLPHPLPPSGSSKDGEGYIGRQGVAVVIPSPWVGAEKNRAAAAYWRSMGFVPRDARDTDRLICTDLKEWVRSIGLLKGKLYPLDAWAAWVDKKYKEFYL